jgi:putative solute:sodium symporter small subunit
LETNTNQYNFSLFKPVSPYGKKNRNLIITLLIIWFLAIFGFQGLLLIFQKPTPEKSLISFESVWENVKSGNASEKEKMDLVNSIIAVTGKSSIKPADKPVLKKVLTFYVFSMINDSNKVLLTEQIKELALTKEKLTKASDAEYRQLQSDLLRIKASINSIANEKTGIDPTNNKQAILPYSLNAKNTELSAMEIEALPKIMKLYLTHNQSFLTDTKFLGFPFHYFYTAEFLLILFVVLSLFYSIRITQIQKKFSIIEE